MDTWRRGSIKSTTFFRRFSLRRHKKLGNQVIILNQNSHTLDSDGQRQKRECLRDLKDKSDYLSCKSEQNLAKAQAPPKPPRLYLDSSSCPNIIDHTDSHSDLSFSGASHQYHKATQTQFHKDQGTDCGSSETGAQNGTPLCDLSDPFLSFKVDLGYRFSRMFCRPSENRTQEITPFEGISHLTHHIYCCSQFLWSWREEGHCSIPVTCGLSCRSCLPHHRLSLSLPRSPWEQSPQALCSDESTVCWNPVGKLPLSKLGISHS